MSNPAEAFSDGPVTRRRSEVTFPPPEFATLGWGFLIAQVVTVAIVYLIGSTVPILPETFQHIQSGADGVPDYSGFIMWLTVVLGMAAGLLVAWAWLRNERRVAEAWTLSAPAIGWTRTLIWAAGATVIIFVIFSVVGALAGQLGLGVPDASLVLDLVTESPGMFALWIVGVAWLAAGTGEELLYRGFLMDRLARVSGLRGRPWLVIVIQAVLFGLPHAYQGIGGMLVTGTVGLFLGWLRMRMNGNLWACIIAHAAVDTIAMSAAYGDTLGWFG